jgi:hypothetical protein
VDRPVPSRGGPAPGGQWWDGFDIFEFGPPKTEPYGTVNRPSLNQTVFKPLTTSIEYHNKKMKLTTWVREKEAWVAGGFSRLNYSI